MIRYIALIWNPGSAIANARGEMLSHHVSHRLDGWVHHKIADGVEVFVLQGSQNPPEVHQISERRGVVLGTIFRRDVATLPSRVDGFTDRESDEIVRTQGHALVERFWGRYVAIIRPRSHVDLHILRAPLGALPCYSSTVDEVDIVCSRSQDWIAIHDGPYSINWQYIAAVASAVGIATSETGLNEISQLRQGECLTVSSNGSRSRASYWDLASIASQQTIDTPASAAEAIRDTTRTCVSSWSSLYPHVLHRLSGGLDSSIVLSCLRENRPAAAMTCVTYYGSYNGGEDEREHARRMARHVGCELIEVCHDNRQGDLPSILELPKGATPMSVMGALAHSRGELHLARERHAPAIFTGTGGDWIFYVGPLERTAADILFAQKSLWRFVALAMHVAHTQRHTLWSVLRRSLTELVDHRSGAPADSSFYMQLAPAAVLQQARDHYRRTNRNLWTTQGIAPGKRRQLPMLTFASPISSPFGTLADPDYVAPLISQPLSEVIARIPTYVLAANGLDRSAARSAFSGQLPKEISQRTAKGMMSTSTLHIFEKYRPLLDQLLRDGVMINRGLLDRGRVSALLDSQDPFLPAVDELLSEHLSIESWLRGWMNDPRCRDARNFTSSSDLRVNVAA